MEGGCPYSSQGVSGAALKYSWDLNLCIRQDCSCLRQRKNNSVDTMFGQLQSNRELESSPASLESCNRKEPS